MLEITRKTATFGHFSAASARSHAADEYIGLQEIREAIDMYVRLLDGLKI